MLDRDEYISLLWTTVMGLLMSVAAIILLVIGILWMRKVAKSCRSRCEMTVVYVGAALIAVVIFALIALLATSSQGPTGVAKSLALIEGTVTDRNAVRTELDAKDRLITPIFRRTRRLAEAISPSGATDRLSWSLDRAGNPSPWTVERVMGAKGAALIVGVLLRLIYGEGLTLRGILFAIVLGVAFFYLSDPLLYSLALRRQERIIKGLAESLDMLTVCVEAGLGFDAAIMQVARNVEAPIAGEFSRVVSEIQIGKSRGEALSALGGRVALPEVNTVTSFRPSSKRTSSASPIAAVLREQTAAMRVARRQPAEEKAQKVIGKILFPLLLCIFPAIFVVIIRPGVIGIIATLFNSGIF